MANGISKSQFGKDIPIVRVSFPSLGGETTPLAPTPSVSVTPTPDPNVVISSDLSVSQCIDSEDASKEKRSLCSKFMRLQLMLDIFLFTASFFFFYDSVKFDYNSAPSLSRDLKCTQGIISSFVLMFLMFVFLKSMCISKR